MSNEDASLLTQSPYFEHINTNYIPTDTQVADIRVHLEPHEAELIRLESLIEQLTLQRNRVRDYILPHRALISHPRRLPPEILEEMFVQCLPTGARRSAVSAMEAPLLLGRICSSWRSIAFGMPRLWTSLHIPLDFFAFNETKETALMNWLERSLPLPLSVSTIMTDVRTHASEHRRLLQNLFQSSARFASLRLMGISAEEFVRISESSAPLLENIEIVFSTPLSDLSGPSLLSSPLLRTMKTSRIVIEAPNPMKLVHTESVPGPWILDHTETPAWNHITHLTLVPSSGSGWQREDVSPRIAHALISGCPNLLHLELPLEHRHWDAAAWAPTARLVTPLESLIIRDPPIAVPCFATLLQRLEMPHLRVLALPSSSFVAAAHESVPDVFFDLARYSPLLSSLSLGIHDFTSRSFLDAAFPLLSALTIRNYCIHNEDDAVMLAAFDALTPRIGGGSEPFAFADLSRLEIVGIISVEDPKLSDLIASHVTCESNLRHLELVVHEHPPRVVDNLVHTQSSLEVVVQYKPFQRKYTAFDGIDTRPAIERHGGGAVMPEVA
ncbi:hypothetical protein R3P38DRAFT_3376633 [Favolaschia claudopus]|uniref:F-box domain-containing protein n=1 Tax=Favolaschia claudopus TaxID=2862362 RepID=A0AAV9ZF71_9AGAR